MTNQILNNALKRLLLTHQPIQPLNPVFDDGGSALRGLLQLGDVRAQFRVCEVAEGCVGGCVEAADGGEVEVWRRCWEAAAGVG